MAEPPDLAEPGGSVPPAASYVTVASSESGMDTDGSLVSSRSVKRSRSHKICKHKKKKRPISSDKIHADSHCSCSEHEIITEQPNDSFVKPYPVHQGKDGKNEPACNNNNPTNNSSPQSHNIPVSVARPQYESTDVAPYVVHVQRIQQSPDDSSVLHPLAFGKLLKRNAFQSIVNGSVKRLGRNRVAIAFSNYVDANAFISHKILAENNLKAFIPSFSVTRMGIVRGVPTEWSPEDIIENITVPLGCGKILKARRLNYKVMVDGTPQWKPTQTIVLTFDGQMLPKRIYICYNALPVDMYTFPTIQCFNCCRYGHTKIQCRSKPRCYKCGQEHTGQTCNIDEDCVSCCLCGGIHYAISKNCPEMSRQKQIKVSMAQNCISYAEAIKLHPSVSRPYAEVAATPKDQPVSSINHSSRYPSTNSYRKTVISKVKSPPKVAQGYNHAAHQALIKDYSPPSPSNGCAYNTAVNEETQSITQIITSLINILLKSNIIQPNLAAPFIELLAKSFTFNNGSDHQIRSSSVELSQHSEQKE